MNGVMDGFNLDGMPSISFGAGVFADAGELIARFADGRKKAMIATGARFAKESGSLEVLTAALAARGIDGELFTGVSPNPRAHEVEAIARQIRETGCEFVIGFGGGSAMDAAKAAAALAVSGGRIWDYVRHWDGAAPPEIAGALPIVAIPTRYGSGAEVSIFSVITNDETKEKAVLASPRIMPALAIVDPEFCRSLTPEQTGFAITDIMAHLIETYISGDDSSPVADSLTEALTIELIENAFRLARLENGAHENIFYVSLLALTGVTHVGRGGDFPLHDLEHPLSALLDIAHGLGLGALFPHLMRCCFEHSYRRYEKLYLRVFKPLAERAEESGTAPFFEAFKPLKDAYGRAENAVECFAEFFKKLGSFRKLGPYGLTEEMLDRLASDAIRLYGHGKPYLPNPKKLRFSDIREIYASAI